MERSRAGGWSWATGGDDKTISQVTSFHGFDYVVNPNYISLDHPALRLESADERFDLMRAGLAERGYSDNQAIDLTQHFETMRQNAPMFESADTSLLESALMIEHGKRLELEERLKKALSMMESSGDVAKARRRLMREAIENMPLFFSNEQKQALCRMVTPEDAKIVAVMLESIGTAAAPPKTAKPLPCQ